MPAEGFEYPTNHPCWQRPADKAAPTTAGDSGDGGGRGGQRTHHRRAKTPARHRQAVVAPPLRGRNRASPEAQTSPAAGLAETQRGGGRQAAETRAEQPNHGAAESGQDNPQPQRRRNRDRTAPNPSAAETWPEQPQPQRRRNWNRTPPPRRARTHQPPAD